MQTKKGSRKLKVSKTRKLIRGGGKVVTVFGDMSAEAITPALADDSITDIVVHGFTDHPNVTPDKLVIIANKIKESANLKNLTFRVCDTNIISTILMISNVGSETNYKTKLNVVIAECTGSRLILTSSHIRTITIVSCEIDIIDVRNIEAGRLANKSRTNANNAYNSTFTYDSITIKECKPFEGANIYVVFTDTITSFGRKVLQHLYIPHNVIYKSINGTVDEPFPANSFQPYELTVHREIQEEKQHGTNSNPNPNDDDKEGLKKQEENKEEVLYETEIEYPRYNKERKDSKEKRRN